MMNQEVLDDMAQEWGAVRLVPLIRERVSEDLRMNLQRFGSPHQQVTVEGHRDKPKMTYTSYIPHGLIVSHGEGAQEAQVAWRTALGREEKERAKRAPVYCPAKRLHRMVKRIGPRSVRMLPMHMALEGFLALHFGGPDIAYEYYSKRSLRDGFSPRVEYGLRGVAAQGGDHGVRLWLHPETWRGYQALSYHVATETRVVLPYVLFPMNV